VAQRQLSLNRSIFARIYKRLSRYFVDKEIFDAAEQLERYGFPRKSAVKELAAVVAPGGVNTPMLWSNPAIKGMSRDDVVYCEPEQIAAVICFLASAEASPINGTTVIADMGLLAAL